MEGIWAGACGGGRRSYAIGDAWGGAVPPKAPPATAIRRHGRERKRGGALGAQALEWDGRARKAPGWKDAFYVCVCAYACMYVFMHACVCVYLCAR